MSGGWEICAEPSHAQREWVSSGGWLFASEEWAAVLRTLGAEPLFAWHKADGLGMVVPVFKRMGFKIGFLGFPNAQPWLYGARGESLAAAAREIAAKARLGLVRINVAGAERWDLDGVAARPEHWISDLGNWHSLGSKRRRRDLGFARRTEALILDELRDAEECHRLYAATVHAHGGRVRYHAEYFRAMAALAETTQRIRFRCAVGAQGEVLGFAILALHGQSACYLHGAASEAGRRQGVSDLLLESIIATAADVGCRRFSLMASPWDQPGLVAFKRKWADTEGLTLTFDFGVGMLGVAAEAASRWAARKERKAASAWPHTA